MPIERDLTEDERVLVARAREKAFVLYEGRRVAHRSCGIALAETWGLETRPYQSLRRGGITGEGECGAIKAGELVLGELLGDPNPAGAVTPELRSAIQWYQREIRRRMGRGEPGRSPAGGGGAEATPSCDIVCNNLTRPLGDFAGEARRSFCTNLAADVAEVVAEALVRHGTPFEIGPIPES